MEFCSEFAILQGTLISAQRNFGALNTIAEDDADSIAAITEAIRNVVEANAAGEENCAAVTEEEDELLRKVSLFLVLNSELSVRISLMDDMNCGHVVGCTPVMSMSLLVALIWRLSFQKYLYETIEFCPPPLGVELLDAARHSLGTQQPRAALQVVDQLCRSAYVRALTLISGEQSHVAMHALFLQFKTLLDYFLGHDVKSLVNFSSRELHIYAGQVLERLLDLLCFCISRCSEESCGKEVPPVYDLKCSWDDSAYVADDCGSQVTLKNFNEALFSVCRRNVGDVTVDEWLEWAELPADSDADKTQQCMLAEKMYACKECLEGVELPGDLGELRSMLASMARKPRDEDDELREAGMEEIVRNVSCPSRSRGKWLKALLTLDDLIKNEMCLGCLEDNLELVDADDAETILQLIITQLNHGTDHTLSERLKDVALSAVRHVPVDCQLKILELHLRKSASDNCILLTTNFKDKVTEALNKAIAAPQDIDRLLSECACLCLESPRHVVERLLDTGVSGPSQGRMVVRVLLRLGAVFSQELLLHSVEDLANRLRHCSDTHKDGFSKFVASLVRQGVLEGGVFMERYLLPALHTSLTEKNWPSVLLWLLTLQHLEATRDGLPSGVDGACLLVVMAQVVEASQWNMFTFSPELVAVREVAAHLLGVLIHVLDASRVQWVQRQLCGFPPHVWSYLSKVWHPWCGSGPMLKDLGVILLYLAHGRDQHSILALQTSQYSRLEWLLALVEVLPGLTASEWDVLAENLALVNTDPLFVFHLVSDSLLFILVAVADIEDLAAKLCVEYLVRNLGALVKTHVCTVLLEDSREFAVVVFEKCMQLISLLSTSAEETTSLQLSNVLVDVMSAATSSSKEHLRRVKTCISRLRDGEMKQALTLKLHTGCA